MSKLLQNRSAGVRKPHTDEVPKHSNITITKIRSKTAFVLTCVSQSKLPVRREAWDTVTGAECPWPSQHIRDAHIVTVINVDFHGQAHAMFSWKLHILRDLWTVVDNKFTGNNPLSLLLIGYKTLYQQFFCNTSHGSISVENISAYTKKGTILE